MKLLDCLPDSIEPKVDLAAIHQFAETCQQFDRGEQRQELTPRARFQQDSRRWQSREALNNAWLTRSFRPGTQGVIPRLPVYGVLAR